MSARIFNVALTVTALVQADDVEHAARIAKLHFREIAGDSWAQDIQAGVMAEITTLSGLPDDWDYRCLPYGGDGQTQLKGILPEHAA